MRFCSGSCYAFSFLCKKHYYWNVLPRYIGATWCSPNRRWILDSARGGTAAWYRCCCSWFPRHISWMLAWKRRMDGLAIGSPNLTTHWIYICGEILNKIATAIGLGTSNIFDIYNSKCSRLRARTVGISLGLL